MSNLFLLCPLRVSIRNKAIYKRHLLICSGIKTTMVERTLQSQYLNSNYKSAEVDSFTGSSMNNQANTRVATFSDPKKTINSSKHPVRPKVPPPSAEPSIQLHPGQKIVPVLQIDTSVKTFFGNVKSMYCERGLRAFTQGFAPTIFRQITYSSVQFATYNALKQAIHSNPNEPMPSYKALLAGFGSGVAVVLATQPIDLVKTRMQSINARTVYRSTPRTFYKVFVEEGVTTFWTGSLPRFAKVVAGSAITFPL